MPQKFQIGEIARVGGKGRRMVAAYPWLKRGQLLKVHSIGGRIAGGHLEYVFTPRRGQPAVRLASFDLRRPNERDRAPGAGPKPKFQKPNRVQLKGNDDREQPLD